MIATPTHSVLALGAWLKNTACWLSGTEIRWSALHGDLDDPKACQLLAQSASEIAQYAREKGRPISVIAHDLHPDFYSTQLACTLAKEWQIPTLGVQHHHAHIAAVMAEHGLREAVIGLALDGVGLGADGTAWGGELLKVSPQSWCRLGHLQPLALPGGDRAAREPWRMLASIMHAVGRGDEIEPRLSPIVGSNTAKIVQRMLDQQLNCPLTTSTGRWFDAAAAALDLHLEYQQEAEAAMALERLAQQWAGEGMTWYVAEQKGPSIRLNTEATVLDLRPLLTGLMDWSAQASVRAAWTAAPLAAAWFHRKLAIALADWAAHAARREKSRIICLGGGCFMNRILTHQVNELLQSKGLRVCRPRNIVCGDAGLALGQAWVVAQMRTLPATVTHSGPAISKSVFPKEAESEICA